MSSRKKSAVSTADINESVLVIEDKGECYDYSTNTANPQINPLVYLFLIFLDGG